MKEILFRGKMVDTGEWIEGYYLKTTTYHGDKFEDHLIIPIDSDSCVLLANFESVIPETVVQYIRTIERNKIFEGDIVKAYKHGNKEEEPFIHEITWRDGTYWFGNWTFLEFLSVFRYAVVIGNIHDAEVCNERDTI